MKKAKLRKAARRDKAKKVPKWQAKGFKHFPKLPVVFLALTLATVGVFMLVLKQADGRPVEEWTTRFLPPSVALSILAVGARAFVDGAYKSGAEAFWWDRLISRSGMTLGDLHHTWQFTQDKLPLFLPRGPWNTVRFAAIATLFLGAVGPIFQRSLTIEYTTQTSERSVTLPIRIEALEHATVQATDPTFGASWSTPMYTDLFAQLAFDYTTRRNPVLRGPPICRGNCTANITLAGFDRSCSEEDLSPDGLPYLRPANVVVLSDRTPGGSWSADLFECAALASYNASRAYATNSSLERSSCDRFQTYYQLAVDLDPTGVPAIYYTSYLGRSDAVPRGNLLVQRCNFSAAFVNMTIDITNRSTVMLSNQFGLPNKRVVDYITGPTTQNVLGGFLQMMRDTYEGYVLFDVVEHSHAVMGSGPRLYCNARDNGVHWNTNQLSVSTLQFRSPLDDFTNTLNEMVLRFTLINPANESESKDSSLGPSPSETRLPTTQTAVVTPASFQTVVLSETVSVAIFRKNDNWALAAALLIGLCVLASGALVQWQRAAGRDFTASPLEVAKAFDAPLLAGVPSGAEVDGLLRRVGRVKVRYGEVRAAADGTAGPEAKPEPDGPAAETDDEQALMSAVAPIAGAEDGETVNGGTVGGETMDGETVDVETGEAGVRRRLRIDLRENVSTPENGVRYMM